MTDQARLIRQVRRRAHLRQADLAVLLGCHQATISKLETGSRTPSADILSRLLEICGADLDGERLMPWRVPRTTAELLRWWSIPGGERLELAHQRLTSQGRSLAGQSARELLATLRQVSELAVVEGAVAWALWTCDVGDHPRLELLELRSREPEVVRRMLGVERQQTTVVRAGAAGRTEEVRIGRWLLDLCCTGVTARVRVAAPARLRWSSPSAELVRRAWPRRGPGRPLG